MYNFVLFISQYEALYISYTFSITILTTLLKNNIQHLYDQNQVPLYKIPEFFNILNNLNISI